VTYTGRKSNERKLYWAYFTFMMHLLFALASIAWWMFHEGYGEFGIGVLFWGAGAWKCREILREI
jgi:hypothetical protein